MGNLPEAHLTIAGFDAIANSARATSAREKLAEKIGVEAVAALVELSLFHFSRAFRQTRLEENVGAVELELTKDDLREIDEAASEIRVEGARYPEKLEAMRGQ